MKDRYFYQERGETIGPLNLDDIRERILAGKVRVFDLVYRDGDEQWKLALEHSALRPEFKSVTSSTLRDRPWVCLHRRSEAEGDFVTNGPFSREDVLAAIKTGELSYSDYAWKEGFPDWKRIGTLEEFNPRVKVSTRPARSVPDETGASLLKNVVHMEPKAHPVREEPPPLEADSIDLVSGKSPASATAITQPTMVDRTATITNITLVPRSTSGTNVTAPTPLPVAIALPRRRRRRRIDWGLVGVIALVLAGSVIILSRLVERTPVLEPTLGNSNGLTNATNSFGNPAAGPSPSVPAGQAPINPASPPVANPGNSVNSGNPIAHQRLEAVKGRSGPGGIEDVDEEDSEAAEASDILRAEQEANKPAEPTKKLPSGPGRIPTQLQLTVQPSGNGGQPRIIVRTDGSKPVFLQIVGRPGQLVSGGSYYRMLRLSGLGDVNKALDVPALALPAGRFLLRAETESLKKEARMSFGRENPEFKTAMLRNRKFWANAIWKERLKLFQLTEKLENQLSTKKFTGHGVEALVRVSKSRGGDFLLFDEWWELHEIAAEAHKEITTELLARLLKEKERLASFSVWK